MEKVIRAVVLDCDGVILESVDVKRQAFARVVRDHGADAEAKILAFYWANGGLGRHVVFEWFYKTVLDHAITQEELARLSERFSQYCYDAVMAAPFVPGIKAFIDRYHPELPMYVASGTPDGELNQIFRDRNLDRFFKGVHGSPPAKTELLAQIVAAAKFAPSEVLMVGDSSTDMEAAESVGTLFYGRGDRFAGSKWPWGLDLRGLGDYVASVS